MTDLVPYDFPPNAQHGFLPSPESRDLDGQVNLIEGVCITLSEEHRAGFLSQLEQWFADRDEVVLIGSIPSEKAGPGMLILEWEGRTIDVLFLSILRTTPFIDDFWVYARHREV
jgi:hypothetical protein